MAVSLSFEEFEGTTVFQLCTGSILMLGTNAILDLTQTFSGSCLRMPLQSAKIRLTT